MLIAADVTMDPYQIFARTREYWVSQKYPARIAYDVVVRVDNGTPRVERYRSGYDAVTGSIAFDAVSDYEVAHPYTPHGFNVFLPGVNLTKAELPEDFLGVPILAPNYAFGIAPTPLAQPAHAPSSAELIREIREEFHDPDPRGSAAPSPEPNGELPEIATVISKARAYDISFDGTDRLDDGAAYHLEMHPLREPHRYRLRDLWVDPATYAPRKLVEALNFVNGPGTAVPWTVTFAQFGGCTYVATETAMGPMSYQRETYGKASVSIENVRAVDAFDSDLSTFVPGDGPLLMVEP
ncbi:MAG: hypothetical protein JO199_09430 [Candidatus Eremiobacteraeota bacterium]|nr:hypothetical protein [Candidatus Eremiobacteraeota bacterium]